MRRLFHLKHVAFELIRIPAILDSPDMCGFAARVVCLVKRCELSAGSVACLFLEFPFSCVERRLAE
jgi:hypothetical protein